MIRYLKAGPLLALVILGALTLGPATSTATPIFESGLEETAVTSTPDGTEATAHHSFILAGLLTTCTGADFNGTQKGETATELLLEAEYTGCSIIGIPTDIKMNGCAFTVHSSVRIDLVSRPGSSCASEPMTINWTPPLSCLAEIGPQAEITPHNGLGAFRYTTIKPGASEEITMEIHLSEVAYTANGPGCSESGQRTNGELTTGNAILTGAEPGGGKTTNLSWNRSATQFKGGLSTIGISSTPDGEGIHHVFEAAGGSLTCTAASLSGQTGIPIVKIALEPTYGGCSFLGEPTTVEVNGCRFMVTAWGMVGIISCVKPLAWEVAVSGKPCRVEVESQMERNLFHLSNIKPGPAKEITMEADLIGVTYTATGAGCPKAGIFGDGKYISGTAILTGSEIGGEGKMTDFYVE